jgi:hypothetical protein
MYFFRIDLSSILPLKREEVDSPLFKEGLGEVNRKKKEKSNVDCSFLFPMSSDMAGSFRSGLTRNINFK